MTALRILALCSAFPVAGAELGRWEAGGTARGLSLVRGPDAGWSIVKFDSKPVARVAAVDDYFRRAAFLVRVETAPAKRVWLAIEYVDSAYGLISLTYGRDGSHGVPQSRQSGVARLNTGKLRRAIFELDTPVFDHTIDRRLNPGADIRIHGLIELRSLALSDTPPPPEAIPHVAPAVSFHTSSQRVTTAGADAAAPEGLPEALASLRNLLPLARALGFNGIESYVKWNFVERAPGVFDWSFYDAVVDAIEEQGLQWFPLLIVGSAYTLPDWYFSSPENVGFECLEHRLRNDIQSIFCDNQAKYVQRFLREFGKHYGRRKALLGVRLGPSGNYGEAQYPARGDWGYRGRPIHTHIGHWAADSYAQVSFRNWLQLRYPTIAGLNRAWADRFERFDDVHTFLPATAATRRKRIDFADWYMGAMSAWCEKWAEWARQALPEAVIHQSSGGWGPVEIGTDYTSQARTMARLHGGIRLTNESDNFPQNFAITRMASSAARFYGARLGYEPGGFGSARGVVARLFNMITNGADHLFYYHSNLYGNDQATSVWLRHAPLLDRRARPLIDVAAFYPDTAIKLDDEPIRYLWASAFLARAEAMRSVVDFDYVSEPMIDDGALDRYKVLVFLWGHVTEKSVLDRIGAWVERGGTLIYPERPRGLLESVEGDLSWSRRWQKHDTGGGRVIFFPGDPEPGEPYAHFVRQRLREAPSLRPAVRRALEIEKPASVYWSVIEPSRLALLNFSGRQVGLRFEGKLLNLKPYSVWIE